MTNDDLDRILASEEPLLPSSGFAAAVLDRVRTEAAAPRPTPFPWFRFAGGLTALLIVSSGTVHFLTADAATQRALADFSVHLAGFFESPAAQALGFGSAALLGSWLLFCITMRLGGVRR